MDQAIASRTARSLVGGFWVFKYQTPDIPLKTLDAEGVRALDRGRPVIVYCYDTQ